MKFCPRCHRKCLEDEDVLNSMSHENQDVYICSVCGQMDGLAKLSPQSVPKYEIELSLEFAEWLKKRKKNGN